MKGHWTNTVFGVILLVALVLPSTAAFAQTSGRPVFDDGHHQVLASQKRGLRGYAPESVYEEGEYKTNRRTGIWKTYFPDGKTKSEITYTNGRKSGPYKVYYEDGTLQEQGDWARNRLKGDFQLNYANGNPRQVFKYDETGKRQGMQEYFYEDGTPMIKVEFKDGKESGIIERYWPNGEIKMRGNYKDGQLDLASVENFEPTKEVPREEPPPPDPPRLPKVLYGDYNPNGHSILYNGDKQPVQVGDFQSGRLYTGKVYNYDDNGLLIDVDVYKEGRWAGKAVREDDK